MPEPVELPGLFHAADQSSLRGQRTYRRLVALQLVFLVGAALTKVADWEVDGTDLAAVLAAGLIVFAGVFRVQSRVSQPAKTWYQGRAAAESAKTLAWRYAVGGMPFPLSLDAKSADLLYVKRLNDVLHDLDGLKLRDVEGEEITDWMRTTRSKSLEDRRQTYRTQRIVDQRSWYERKAAWNTRRSELFSLVTLVFEAAAILQAVLKATGLVDVDLIAFFVTLIAGVVAWVETKDFTTLSSAYTVAARELAAIDAVLVHQDTEEEWAGFVEHAEDSISREHTLWRASRS